MISDDQLDTLENQVGDILEAAGWADASAADDGRVEVIAYRACLEAARQAPSGPTCSSVPTDGSAPAHAGGAIAPPDNRVCEAPAWSAPPSRFGDDRHVQDHDHDPDEDPCAGSTRH